MINNTQEMFKAVRNGEKIICPLCKIGNIVPVGNLENTKAIRCDNCGKGIVQTVALRKENRQ